MGSAHFCRFTPIGREPKGVSTAFGAFLPIFGTPLRHPLST